MVGDSYRVHAELLAAGDELADGVDAYDLRMQGCEWNNAGGSQQVLTLTPSADDARTRLTGGPPQIAVVPRGLAATGWPVAALR